jgi:hypothetical protein
MIIVIVGFKITEPNSTYYKKINVVSLPDEKFNLAMTQALKASDFISVRKVK